MLFTILHYSGSSFPGAGNEERGWGGGQTALHLTRGRPLLVGTSPLPCSPPDSSALCGACVRSAEESAGQVSQSTRSSSASSQAAGVFSPHRQPCGVVCRLDGFNPGHFDCCSAKPQEMPASCCADWGGQEFASPLCPASSLQFLPWKVQGQVGSGLSSCASGGCIASLCPGTVHLYV